MAYYQVSLLEIYFWHNNFRAMWICSMIFYNPCCVSPSTQIDVVLQSCNCQPPRSFLATKLHNQPSNWHCPANMNWRKQFVIEYVTCIPESATLQEAWSFCSTRKNTHHAETETFLVLFSHLDVSESLLTLRSQVTVLQHCAEADVLYVRRLQPWMSFPCRWYKLSSEMQCNVFTICSVSLGNIEVIELPIVWFPIFVLHQGTGHLLVPIFWLYYNFSGAVLKQKM